MSCRCILAISDGETDSTLVGAVDRKVLECLGGSDAEGGGLGGFVVGWVGIRVLTLWRDRDYW